MHANMTAAAVATTPCPCMRHAHCCSRLAHVLAQKTPNTQDLACFPSCLACSQVHAAFCGRSPPVAAEDESRVEVTGGLLALHGPAAEGASLVVLDITGPGTSLKATGTTVYASMPVTSSLWVAEQSVATLSRCTLLSSAPIDYAGGIPSVAVCVEGSRSIVKLVSGQRACRALRLLQDRTVASGYCLIRCHGFLCSQLVQENMGTGDGVGWEGGSEQQHTRRSCSALCLIITDCARPPCFQLCSVQEGSEIQGFSRAFYTWSGAWAWAKRCSITSEQCLLRTTPGGGEETYEWEADKGGQGKEHRGQTGASAAGAGSSKPCLSLILERCYCRSDVVEIQDPHGYEACTAEDPSLYRGITRPASGPQAALGRAPALPAEHPAPGAASGGAAAGEHASHSSSSGGDGAVVAAGRAGASSSSAGQQAAGEGSDR